MHLVNPAVDADLVAFGDDTALFVGMEERGDGGNEEAHLHIVARQQRQQPGHADACTIFAQDIRPSICPRRAIRLFRDRCRRTRQRRSACRLATGAAARPARLAPDRRACANGFPATARVRSCPSCDDFLLPSAGRRRPGGPAQRRSSRGPKQRKKSLQQSLPSSPIVSSQCCR